MKACRDSLVQCKEKIIKASAVWFNNLMNLNHTTLLWFKIWTNALIYRQFGSIIC